MDGADVFGVGLVARLLLGPLFARSERKKIERANARASDQNSKALSTLLEFTSEIEWVGGLNEDAVAMDGTRRLLALSKQGQKPTVISFDQLSRAQIVRNGEVVGGTDLSNSTAGAAAGAALGGALFGGVGLIAGMLAGAQRGFKKTRRLSLRIGTRDIRSPIVEIVFLDHAKGLERSDPVLLERATVLDEWCARVQAAMSHSPLSVS